MAFHPLVIHIGGVDEVSAMAAVGIHYQVGFGFIGISAKNVAAKAEWVNYQVSFWDSDHARRLRHNCRMSQTTGGFSSAGLALEARTLELASLSQKEAIKIGEIALDLGFEAGLPIAIEVRLKDWVVFHASLPGSTPENDFWIARKARVVLATGNSTMYERVLAEEQGIDWYAANQLPEATHAVHGGGLPLNVKGFGALGILLISGLPQVQDHLFGVEVLTEFLARTGEVI